MSDIIGDSLNDLLRSSIPNIQAEEVQLYCEEMVKLGVETKEDLELLQASDLPFMKLIHARKLLNSVSSCGASSASHSFDSPFSFGSPVHSHHQSQELTNFVVPWQKMPKSFLTFCQEGKQLPGSVRREFVRIVSNEALTLCQKPTRKELKKICFEIVNLYPKTFQDVDNNGQKLGEGIGSLIQQLESRFANESRKSSTPKRHYSDTEVDDTTTTTIESQEDNEIQLSKKAELIEMFDNPLLDQTKVTSLMKDTFQLRASNMSKLPFSQALEEWPFLFSDADQLALHFEIQTKQSLSGFSHENLKAKSMIDFARQSKSFKSAETNRWVTITENACLQEGNHLPYNYGFLMTIVKMLQDDEDLLVRFYAEDVTVSVIESDIKLPLTPVIAVRGSSIFAKNVFFIAFERICLSLSPVTFLEAVQTTFALYWCMNVQYPPGLSNFLGFVERFLVGMNVRAKQRKGGKVKSRLFTLMTAISSYQKEWASTASESTSEAAT